MLVEDRSGRFLQAFLSDDGMWRLKTSPDEIPDKLKQVLVQREDQFFYYHPGINPFAIVRAMIQNLSSGKTVSGASTITMQVARMLDRQDRTYLNKAIEMFRALQLEMKYSKNEILEMYLSMIPLGGNIEGLKSASLIYYQTPIERLNIAQLFDLTLIPSSPNRLRPDRHGERLFAARKRQAATWITKGYFTREDSVVIWQTPASAERTELPRLAPHFSLRIRDAFPDVVTLRSSLDLDVQQTVENLLSLHLRDWKKQGSYNGAVLVLENHTGKVLAYCGSEDFNDPTNQGQYDAVRAIRSPGSTLKPFLYAQAMEQGLLTPKTVLLDVPYDVDGFTPENYTGNYSGPVWADAALRRSLNVPMIRLLQEVGVPYFLDFLIKCQFVSIPSQREKLGLSTIVGGCGVTLEELTAAYSAFVNGGNWIRPRLTADSAVTDESDRIFSPSTAFMITEILAGLDRPDLPVNYESSKNLCRIAFKTGTSYGRRDAWSIGYSADYTVGVWIGNVSNRGHSTLVAGKSAAPLLIDILNAVSTHTQVSILQKPTDVGTRKVCLLSGKIPGPHCSQTVDDYFSITNTSNLFCDVEKEFMVSEDGSKSYCLTCAGTHRFHRAILADYPPELVAYWKESGLTPAQPPKHNPECGRFFTGEGPRIASPSSAETYFLTSKGQKIPLQANTTVDVHKVSWYFDDEFLGQKSPEETVFIQMDDGKHTVACVDDKGRRSSVRFTVIKAF